MNRKDWDDWRVSAGPRKALLTARMLRENEPLAQKCAAASMQRSRLHLADLADDVHQAARIGLLRAFERWDPARGAFSTCAYFWMRHEIQQVLRDATPLTLPRSATLPRRAQDAAAAHYAKTGTEPAAADIGVSDAAAARAEMAAARFVPLETLLREPDETDIEAVAVESQPEADIDRARDMAALKVFVGKLSAKDRAEFWTGDRPDLIDRAKRYVEGRRAVRVR